MNLWRRQPLTENPYYATAFRVARVPRETDRHRTIVQLIRQVRQIIKAEPGAHVIRGVPVSEAAVNAAEQILSEPHQRILEELLTHATERLPLARVRKLAAEAAQAMASEPGGPLPVKNLRALDSWARAAFAQFLDDAPAQDPSLGALELDLIPPFGRAGKERHG